MSLSLLKLDFVFACTCAERGVVKELLDRGFFAGRRLGLLLHKLKPSGLARIDPAIQDDLHPKALEVDVPRLDRRMVS